MDIMTRATIGKACHPPVLPPFLMTALFVGIALKQGDKKPLKAMESIAADMEGIPPPNENESMQCITDLGGQYIVALSHAMNKPTQATL